MNVVQCPICAKWVEHTGDGPRHVPEHHKADGVGGKEWWCTGSHQPFGRQRSLALLPTPDPALRKLVLDLVVAKLPYSYRRRSDGNYPQYLVGIVEGLVSLLGTQEVQAQRLLLERLTAAEDHLEKPDGS